MLLVFVGARGTVYIDFVFFYLKQFKWYAH